MRKLFVLAMATAALCPLAISVEPALGFEFESETALSSTTTSSTQLLIQLGASGWVECSSIKLKASPETTGVKKILKVKIEEQAFCAYEDNAKMVGEQVSAFEPKCPIFLESEKLEELSSTLFNEGLAELNCLLEITTKGSCKIIVGPPSAVREFEWKNTDLMAGHHESLLKLELKHLKYTISSGCGSNGTGGEFDVSVPIQQVIVVP